jgi:uncharacterized protein (DUF4415 family)
MNQDTTLKPFPETPEEIEAAIEQAPDWVDDPECPYDPNDPEAIEAFWRNAKVIPPRRPGERGKQKAPTKAQITLRLSPEVVAYFKAQGKGWQTRIDEALKEWIASHG